ncbi:MAG: hypothetical protein M0R03_02580 [Novosphingobium sp.]|nr:hypothetical protein [Novosphingobium sp.]
MNIGKGFRERGAAVETEFGETIAEGRVEKPGQHARDMALASGDGP